VVVADAAGTHTEHHDPQIRAAGLQAPEKPAQLQYTAPGEDGATQTRIEGRASGRSGNPAKAASQDQRKQAKKKRR
jgi:preprotein translocase subunit SecA